MKLKMKILGFNYYYLSFFFKLHLTRLFFKNKYTSVFVRFNLLLEPTALFFAKYICKYLKRGLSLNQVVKSLFNNISKMYPNIIAVNVKCRGRHTRNERASRN
jgi:hypothetical protein